METGRQKRLLDDVLGGILLEVYEGALEKVNLLDLLQKVCYGYGR